MDKKVLASCTGFILVVDKGEKGATERPRKWEDIPSGDSLQCGGAGEQWIDIVFYGESWYQCIKSHTKGNGVVPTNTIYYKAISDYKRLATDIFLANRAFINNLQVGDVLIQKDGKTLFVANEDGVECNNGKFNNVEVNGIVTSVGSNYTVKIDNGVIYFITNDATYHLGLDSSGKPDWLSNKPYVYTSTFYRGDMKSSSTSVTLYTTDKKTYYTDVNLTTKASGTYYSLENRGDVMLRSSEGIYCVYGTTFSQVSLYRKCTFSNGNKTNVGFIAVGYNFYLNDTSNKFEKYSTKVYFKPIQITKDGLTASATIREILANGTAKTIERSSVDISLVSGSYIYPIESNGNSEAVFSSFSTISQLTSATKYSVQNVSI